MKPISRLTLIAVCLFTVPTFAQDLKPGKDVQPGYRRSAWFREQIHEEWIEGDVRVLINLAENFDPKRGTRLIIFATPNGNTIENTLGCAKANGLDWHFDIQHIAAQVRKFRSIVPNENVALACIEAEGLSWPSWRSNHKDAPEKARRVIDRINDRVGGTTKSVSLTGHSGGGSFTTAILESADAIPDFIDRIAYLDSNYSYNTGAKHGDKLLAWLQAGKHRRLEVIAYDDRNIMLNGKLVVSATGGTFRATERMKTRFENDVPLTETTSGDFVINTGLDGRLVMTVHKNPKNVILHTVLVGDMNGLLKVLTAGEMTASDWGQWGGPRAYTSFVQPAPAVPERPKNAKGGAEFAKLLEQMPPAKREEAISDEIIRGNFPQFLRNLKPVTIKGVDTVSKEHRSVIEVMPDYLAIGSDTDFVRMPMTPMTAQRIADAFGFVLPTKLIVDEVYKRADVKLEPIPMTEAREAVGTFVQHNSKIEEQRIGKELGALVAGIKKDIVVSNRLNAKADRVAIYGWHKLDGTPIQLLNVNHVNWYVDYSHGVRLVKRTAMIDGKPQDIRLIIQSAKNHTLLSDEGPILRPTY